MSFLDNYEDVAARISRLWATHPTARVQTNIIDFNAEKGYVLIQAQIFREYEDLQPSATDYAFGNVATYNVNMKKFFIEDTVTSAIGRAIGLLLGADKRPTRQDMEKVETISAKVANSTADDYDPWAVKFGEIPSYKTAGEAEQSGIPSLGSSMDEIAKQLGGELVAEAPQCAHGHRIWKQAHEGAPKNWGGYFCTERTKATQCAPNWYVLASDGKWKPQV
ncbi:hypothetical protein UFOVP362_9 [uncultured Caudovirales phage]|uniref:Uncharacterized protein n=1 Tax=uncultured Caudovirales phage TaxID=2100421 RepID=A0A6J7WWL5_9CAUD|nr:hypothetical protein UFOVP362_9 [uncultured Caudovirales phage]